MPTPVSLRCVFLAEDMTPLAQQTASAEIIAAPPLQSARMGSQGVTNAMGEFLVFLPDGNRPWWVLVGVAGAAFFVDASQPRQLPSSLKCWLGEKPSAICTATGDVSKVALFLRLQGTSWWLRLPPFKDGQLLLFRLPRGQHQLVLASASLPSYWDGIPPLQSALLEVTSETPTQISFSIPPLGRVVGVVQTAQGQPIANASVVLERNGVNVANAFTDPQGRFSLDGIPEGSYRLIASASDYESALVPLQVRPDQEAAMLVTLTPQSLGILRGRVVNKDGSLPQNGRLLIERIVSPTLRQPAGVWAIQPDGRFEGKLREGTYRLTVQVGGRRLVREVRIVARQVTDLGDLFLPPPAIVEGIVKGALPLTDLRLRIVALNGTDDPLQPQWANIVGEVPIQSDGRFQTEVPAEPVALILQLPGSRPLVQRVHARFGQRVRVQFILPRFGSIEGQVIRADTGRPVPGAIVTLLDETGIPIAQAMTNPLGFYRFEPIAPGRYSVRCQGRGLAISVRHEVLVGDGMKVPVDFVLTVGGSIVGSIRANKTPLQRLYVMVDADTNLVSSVTPDGRFRVDFIPPGRHIVMLFRLGEQVAAKEVVVKSGEEAEVVFDLP
ncbi:MAG: hypothetical protein OXFUSZZB_000486 [Candidatus Fervidibacter sp.]